MERRNLTTPATTSEEYLHDIALSLRELVPAVTGWIAQSAAAPVSVPDRPHPEGEQTDLVNPDGSKRSAEEADAEEALAATQQTEPVDLREPVKGMNVSEMKAERVRRAEEQAKTERQRRSN